MNLPEWLGELLYGYRHIAVDGADPVNDSDTINLSSAFTAVYNPTTKRVDVGLSGGATFASLTVTGTITQGALSQPAPFSGTTTGSETRVLTTIPLAVNKTIGLELVAYGFCDAQPGAFSSATAPGDYFSSHSPAGLYGPRGGAFQAMGISPALAASWSAGLISITAYGPIATITNVVSNGDMPTPHCRVTVAAYTSPRSPLDPLDDTLDGKSVTIAGVTGCTEANGSHVATYVDPTTFDLLTVPFVHAYTGGPGTVVLTTPPVIDWIGYLRVLTPT